MQRWIYTLAVCALLSAVSAAQQAPKQESAASVTIVTAGDISITKGANGKKLVRIDFVRGQEKSTETRITISGPYILDVNGGVQEVKGAQGVELHVLSHEELRFEASEVSEWEQSHKFSQSTACSKIPAYPACGNPVCDLYGHPADQCRYNSSSGCSCVTPTGAPCGEASTSSQEKK